MKILIALVMMLALSACASSPKPSSHGSQMCDNPRTEALASEYFGYPVNPETYDGYCSVDGTKFKPTQNGLEILP